MSGSSSWGWRRGREWRWPCRVRREPRPLRASRRRRCAGVSSSRARPLRTRTRTRCSTTPSYRSTAGRRTRPRPPAAASTAAVAVAVVAAVVGVGAAIRGPGSRRHRQEAGLGGWAAGTSTRRERWGAVRALVSESRGWLLELGGPGRQAGGATIPTPTPPTPTSLDITQISARQLTKQYIYNRSINTNRILYYAQALGFARCAAQPRSFKKCYSRGAADEFRHPGGSES